MARTKGGTPPSGAKQANTKSSNGQPLELEDDTTFYRRELLMRRIGTVALSLLLLAALVGLFGSGPLSNAVARSQNGAVEVRYERFTRAQAGTTLRLTLRSAAVVDGVVQISVNNAFADKVKIEEVLPDPTRVAVSQEKYVFDVASIQPDGTLEVVVRYQPESLGTLSIVLGVGAEQVRFWQLVYP